MSSVMKKFEKYNEKINLMEPVKNIEKSLKDD